MFKNIFNRKKKVLEKESDEIFPIPDPSLISVLLKKEQEKGAPLTKDEVLKIRDECECVMLTLFDRDQLYMSRGEVDIDPGYAWEHWQEAREEFNENS